MNPISRPKIVVLNPFPVYPPVSGGQCRVFNLYKYMACYFDLVIICFGDRRSYQTISPNLQQIMIPKSHLHCQMELELLKEIGFITCAILTKTASLTPEYSYTVKQQTDGASAIILSHPYLYEQVQQIVRGKILIYDAHNVEYQLHREILPANQHWLLKDIEQSEKAACEHSRIIAACSQRDAYELASLYNVPSSKLIVIPNGVDIEIVHYVPFERRKVEKTSRRTSQPTVIFMGSQFPPNVQAAEQVIDIASQLPRVNFLLLGSICSALVQQAVPRNVALLGVVSEKEKCNILGLADIALNPVLSGSGTNLKVLEYMAAGIPVVTTALGSRGINGENGRHFIVSDCKDMPAQILSLLNNQSMAASISHQAYMMIKDQFDWKLIARKFAKALSAVIPSNSKRGDSGC